MSWYYNYYLGYKKDGKYYPLGLFDGQGKIHSVFSRSRSFASDMWKVFTEMKPEEASDELKAAFPYEFKEQENTMFREPQLSFLRLDELTTKSYIKSGYFLIKDVKYYLEDYDAEDLFYKRLSPEIYAAKLLAEAHSKPKTKQKKKFDDDDEYDSDDYLTDLEHPASDYMYFAYPDYNCEEYEAFLLREAASAYEYAVDGVSEKDFYVFLTQG